MNDKRDLQDLALNLDKLTEEGGPLLRLVYEVRKSNDLATRNVRLQLVSLFALSLCLVCLFLLGVVFYEGLGKLKRSEVHLVDITGKLTGVALSVGEMKSEVEESPKIVADDNGQLKMVANIQIDETLTGQQNLQQLKDRNQEVGEYLQGAIDTLGEEAEPKKKTKSGIRKVEIPLDVKRPETDD